MNDTTNSPDNTGAAPAVDTTLPADATPSLDEVLKFDPFGPPKAPAADKTTSPAQTADAKRADGKPGTTPQAPKPGTADAKPATPQAPSKTPEQLIAEHTASIRQMLERAPQTAPAAPAAKDEPEAPKFNLGIPDQLLSAMSSEDPKERSLATHALVNGVANAVWRETQNMFREQIDQVVAAFPRIIESHIAARTEQQRVFNDFYGTYKQFNGPQWVPLVQAHTVQLMNEMAQQGIQINGWTPEMRDEIANRIFAQFPMLRNQQQPAGTTPQPRPRSFATGANGGARPATEAGPVNEMLAVLGKPTTQ
jgi:hypothetical protein